MMIELFNYFTTKFQLFYVVPEELIKLITSEGAYEDFLYYSLYAMQDNGYMFMSPELFDKFNAVFDKYRYIYTSRKTVELENEIIARENVLESMPREKLDKMGDVATEFEYKLHCIPFYKKYSREFIANVVVNDLPNILAVTDAEPECIADKLDDEYFVYTLSMLTNLDMLSLGIPRLEETLEKNKAIIPNTLTLLDVIANTISITKQANISDFLNSQQAKKVLRKVRK